MYMVISIYLLMWSEAEAQIQEFTSYSIQF